MRIFPGWGRRREKDFKDAMDNKTCFNTCWKCMRSKNALFFFLKVQRGIKRFLSKHCKRTDQNRGDGGYDGQFFFLLLICLTNCRRDYRELFKSHIGLGFNKRRERPFLLFHFLYKATDQ